MGGRTTSSVSEMPHSLCLFSRKIGVCKIFFIYSFLPDIFISSSSSSFLLGQMLEYEEDLYGLCRAWVFVYLAFVCLCYRNNQVVYYLGLGSSFTALLQFAFQLFHLSFWELSRENKLEHFFLIIFFFHSEV